MNQDTHLIGIADTAAAQVARSVLEQLPSGGLFAGHQWRIAPSAFPLEGAIAREIESLGRVLLQFYRSANLLYRQSVAGRQPAWIANLIDSGKPARLIELQRSAVFKNEVPRVIRPDLLLTETGLSITELDSVPGGIGLTAWLNRAYRALPAANSASPANPAESQNGKEAGPPQVVGGADGMVDGFRDIFGSAGNVHIVVSDEAAAYRPEMEWLCAQLGPRFAVRDGSFKDWQAGDSVYRFFELFDLPNIPAGESMLDAAARKEIQLTPPPAPVFEEKLWFALLWNRNLRGFWRQELGESFLNRLCRLVPYTWVMDPAPLPPHAAIPELNLTDWHQLKALSQKERELILKISGYSELAWGARGVHLGSDLSQAEWSVAVETAINSFERSPYILQRYHKPRLVDAAWFDFESNRLVPMPGRVRLCPYYFVHGNGDSARAKIGGILATICPADKKIIHGMRDAILAPCAA